jgi:hypothetical protein
MHFYEKNKTNAGRRCQLKKYTHMIVREMHQLSAAWPINYRSHCTLFGDKLSARAHIHILRPSRTKRRVNNEARLFQFNFSGRDIIVRADEKGRADD